jgi:hypothetical protein
MGFFNFLDTVAENVNKVSSTVQSARNFVDMVRDPAKLISSIRSRSIPSGAVPQGRRTVNGSFVVADQKDGQDWRVRIHLPAQPSTFETSKILQPLVKSNGSMVFPTTPQILVTHGANYNMMHPVHTNYAYPVYENSMVEDITISGEFPVENEADGAYWIASVHFMRSITKMFYGEGDLQGSPPPRCALSGYGDFIFDQMPIVIKMFSIDLPNNVDYIKVPIDGEIYQDAILRQQGYVPKTSTYTYVPTLSTINITVAPAFSRDATRQFNLTDFINGDYVGNGGGFI